MKYTRILPKEWNKLLGKSLPKMKVSSGDANWIFDLLGWKKDVKRSTN